MSGFGASFGQPQGNVFGGGGGGFGASQTPFGGATPAASSSAFGGTGGGGLFGGQQQPQAFGGFAQPSTGFGAPANGFGASASAFGQSNAGFGASSSLFGAPSAFGAPASWSGGGFGASTSAFGATATPFGASSASFGTNSLFGSAPSSSSLFGGNSNAAFGSTPFQQSQSLFAASSSSFGGSSFSSSSLFAASSSSLFGANAGGAFGVTPNMQPRVGTAGVNWQLTVEYEGNPSNQSKYNAISMMSEFRDKSFEELRCEDYAAGNKDGNQSSSNPSNTLFANTAQAAPSTGLFGSTSGGFGESNSFGASAGQSLFGAQSSSAGLFLGGTFGSSNPSQSAGGLFSGNNSFGSQPATNLFGGQSGGGFGASSAALFGGNSGSLFGQSTANTFGQGGGGFGAFGATGPQPQGLGQTPQQNTLFGASQSGAATAFGQPAPSGQNLFGSASFGGGGAGGLFGGGGNTQTPSSFGNAATITAQPQAGGLFGTFGGNNSGFGAPGAAQGLGNGFPSAIGVNPSQSNMSGGGFVGQNTVPLVSGSGSNPTLAESYNAVLNNGGATAAPPGASYAAVIYNLQRIQKDLEEHKHRSAAQEQEKQEKESLSVVVMPAPPLMHMSSNRFRLHTNTSTAGGRSLGVQAGSLRTPMRGIAGSKAVGIGMVSGTPYPRQHVETFESETPASERKAPIDRNEVMPFFTPQQFSGAKRRPLRASEIGTPVVAHLRDSGKETARRVSFGGNLSPSDNKSDANKSDLHAESENKKEPDASTKLDEERDTGGESVKDEDIEDLDEARRDSSNFLWSGKRPSQWSRNRGLMSDDQYNPCQYVPICTKSDYYTIPSQAELSVLSMLELQHVERFTVGRIGYGEIEWMEPVDVRGLMINECVEIDRGEVAVFPDREASQLNAPAKVTLEEMFPKSKGSESDKSTVVERYRNKLKNFCNRNGLHFVSYDEDKGLWSFTVDNF